MIKINMGVNNEYKNQKQTYRFSKHIRHFKISQIISKDISDKTGKYF